MNIKLWIGVIVLFLLVSAEFSSVESRKHKRKHRGQKKRRHNKKHDRRREIDPDQNKLNGTSRLRVRGERFEPRVVHPVTRKPVSFDVEEWREALIQVRYRSKNRTLHRTTAIVSHHSTSEDVEGKLLHILDDNKKSHFGCSNAIANIGEIPSGQPWVALVKRGKCLFFIKIRLARLHNASAVIIYNNEENSHVMNTAGTSILSMMIGKSDGKKLAKLASSEEGVHIKVTIGNITRKASLKKKNPPGDDPASSKSTSNKNPLLLDPNTTPAPNPPPGNSAPSFHPQQLLLIWYLVFFAFIIINNK